MTIQFDPETKLVPAIIQDARTHAVLMLGYMNHDALEKTRRDGQVTFFSRSKNRLWTKGETSGHFLNVVSIKPDCDGDTLLIRVNPTGSVCHTGTDTCWGEDNVEDASAFLSELEAVISERKKSPSENSYTSALFQKGLNKIAQKVGEEAVELVIEAKDNNDELFLNEAADLLFHYIVLLHAKDLELDDVINVLRSRRK